MYSDGIKSIVSGADVAFVNQEGPMVPDMPAAGYPAFNAPTEAGDALVNMGFDIVNLANNHMLDMEGKCEGLRGTMNYWKSKNVLSVGAYESMEDYNTIRLLESKGKRIAVLSYTYGTNGNRLNAASSDLVIPLIDDSTIIDQVARGRDCADAVIVSKHWGEENVMTQNDEQKRLAALLSKYGADVDRSPLAYAPADGVGDRRLRKAHARHIFPRKLYLIAASVVQHGRRACLV